jgi:hypothetical protein
MMVHLRRTTVTLCAALGLAHAGMATHLVGGEMYYNHLGNDQYEVNVMLYRDCTGIAYDSYARLGIYSGSGSYLFTHDIPFPGATDLPDTLITPCFAYPTGTCIQGALHTTTLTLPPIPDGYVISFLRCCRSGSVQNIVEPANAGMALQCRIPGQAQPTLGSPRFNGPPPIALCLGQEFVMDHSAFDPDGDSLAYRLADPLMGGFVGNPYPTPSPATAPPYAPIAWLPGYNTQYPMDAAPAMAIDPITGELTVTGTTLGTYLVGVQVDKYRDGELLQSTFRDYHFTVLVCDQLQSAGLTTDPDACTDLFIQFVNTSVGATTYAWDFGDPATTADTSSAVNPGWNYSAPGIYTVTLIAGPGTTCADTAQLQVELVQLLQPTISAISNVLTASPAFSYQWLLDNDTIPGATAQVLEATQTGNYRVRTREPGQCSATSEEFFLVVSGMKELAHARMRSWPVPADDVLYVKLDPPPAAGSVLTLHDATGRLLRTEVVAGRSRLELPVQELATGIYLLRLQGAQEERTMRFTKR